MSKVQNTGDDKLLHAKAVVYAYPNTGKTTMAKDLKVLGKVLIVSAEGGLHSLVGENIDYVPIESVEDVVEFFDDLHAGEYDAYDVLFVDSLTEIGKKIEQDIFAKFAVEEDGVISVPEKKNFAYYGALKNELEGFVRAIRDVKKHIILTALPHQWKDDKTGEGGVRIKYGAGAGQHAPWELYDFIFAYRILPHPETGEETRVLFTTTDENWSAKSRQQWDAPPLDACIVDPNLGQIIQTLLKGSK